VRPLLSALLENAKFYIKLNFVTKLDIRNLGLEIAIVTRLLPRVELFFCGISKIFAIPFDIPEGNRSRFNKIMTV